MTAGIDYEAALERLYADYSVGNYDGVTTADECFGEYSEAVHHALSEMVRMQKENLVMVPREPTEEMINLGFRNFQRFAKPSNAMCNAYRAMIAASQDDITGLKYGKDR